jgi:hypothetical protein
MRTPPGGRTPRKDRLVAGRAEHGLGRDDAGREDALVAVDVVEEGAQGPQALLEAALDVREVGGRDQAWHQAKREDLLGAAGVGVDRERDALVEQRGLGELLVAGQLFLAQPIEGVGDPGERRARPVGADQLVEGPGQRGVARQERSGHGASP